MPIKRIIHALAANLQRYDALRNAQPPEASPESDHA